MNIEQGRLEYKSLQSLIAQNCAESHDRFQHMRTTGNDQSVEYFYAAGYTAVTILN
jgi:hypothetical protein